MSKIKSLLILAIVLSCRVVHPKEQTLRIIVPTKLDNADPAQAWSTSELMITAMYCRPLLKVSQNGRIEGELVKSWSISQDFKEYIFTLNDQILFHDGTKLSSEDVAYSLSRHYWENSNSGYRHHMAFFTGTDNKVPNGTVLKNFRVRDSTTFEIRAEYPYLPLLKMLSQTGLCIVKKDNPLVGTGPMMIAKNQTNKSWLLHKFDNYHGKPSKSRTIYISPEYDQLQAIRKIRASEVDIAIGSLYSNSSDIKNNEKHLLDFISINHFLINHKSEHFISKTNRKFFGQLLQNLAWKKENLPWDQRKSTSIVPTGYFSSSHLNQLKKIEKNNISISNIKPKFNRPIRIALIRTHFSTDFIEDLRATLKQLGIPLKLNLLEPHEWIDTINLGKFDITHFPMQPSFYDPDGMFITVKSYFPPETEKAFEKMSRYRNLVDKKHRMRGYSKVLREIQDSWILVPAYRKYVPYVTNRSLTLPDTAYKNELEIWEIIKHN